MQDLFSGIMPFLAVAEELSFRAAARRLGVTPAAVSKAVSRLEDDLGVRLLHRTTRTVTLSPAGEQFLVRCREAVAQLKAGRAGVLRAQREPRGELTLSMSHVLAEAVTTRLPSLLERYAGLSLTVLATDRFVNLVDEAVDVALRIGALSDSSLVAKKLFNTRWTTVAAPSYLARRGTPQTPVDLHQHECLRFISPRGLPMEWVFRGDAGASVPTARLSGRLSADQGQVLIHAAVRGVGIVQAMDFMVAPMLAAGTLVEVLASRRASGPPVHALCRPGESRSPRVRAVLDFVHEVFKQGYVRKSQRVLSP